MKLFELKPAEGATKERYRKGRGIGSGNGKTAGKGHKVQKARSGGSIRPSFEGGQLPLARRIPKRGFKNIFATEYVAINVESLNSFEAGAIVDADALIEAGIIKKTLDGVKILGGGEISKAITVRAAKFSKSAKEKIEAAGGKTEVVA